MYTLKESIYYRPTAPGTAAITIRASGVILKLGRFSLIQKNTVQDTYGIAIARGSNRVKVAGVKQVAQIKNFTLGGVRLLGNTDNIILKGFIVTHSSPQRLTNDQIPEQCCDLITLRMPVGIIIGEGNTSYIAFAGTSRFNTVTNLTLKDIEASNNVIGCHIIFTSKFLVEDCLFTKNSYYGILVGSNWVVYEDPVEQDPFNLVFPQASDFVFRRVRGDGNSGPLELLVNPAESYVFDFLSGISCNHTENGTMIDCGASDNFSQAAYLLAIDHDQSRGMVWRNTVTNNNTSLEYICDGFHMSGSIPSTAIFSCRGIETPLYQNIDVDIRDLVSTGNSGYFSSGVTLAYMDGVNIENANCSGNFSTLGFFSNGFWVTGEYDEVGGECRNIRFKNCIAQRNGREEQVATGFHITIPSYNIVLDECTAMANGKQASLAGVGILIGNLFQEPTITEQPGVEKVLVKNCTVTDNGTLLDFSAGVLINRYPGATSVGRVVLDNNDITDNGAHGIRIHGEIPNVVVKNNELLNNRGGGVFINENTNRVLVAQNTAYNNQGGNYTGVPEGTVIETTVETLPDTVGLKNVSIV